MTDRRDQEWEERRKQERIDRGIEEDLRRAEEAERKRQITMDYRAEKNARDALAENMRIERGMSRGGSGGCSQDADNLRR